MLFRAGLEEGVTEAVALSYAPRILFTISLGNNFEYFTINFCSEIIMKRSIFR